MLQWGRGAWHKSGMFAFLPSQNVAVEKRGPKASSDTAATNTGKLKNQIPPNCPLLDAGRWWRVSALMGRRRRVWRKRLEQVIAFLC